MNVPFLRFTAVNVFDPDPTLFDWSFRLFRTRVRVSAWFWALPSALGLLIASHVGAAYFFVVVGCTFLSILLHEFGHVAAGRRFGANSAVVLHGIGGAALGCADVAEPWQRVVVYLAGPLAQLLLGGTLWLTSDLFVAWLVPATELAFEFPFFGDFKADLILGNKSARKFCVVEFEDGRPDSIFKKQPARGNPEWSARFEHGFSQLTDWFYNLDDFKTTKGFTKTFGAGHVKCYGLLLVGRDAGLDDAKRNRLDWRTEKVLIDSHPITCLTFDALYASLHRRFLTYRAAAKLEAGKKAKK